MFVLRGTNEWLDGWERRTFVGERLHVEDGDLDALLCEQQHDALADTVGATRHDNHLLVPVPLIALPVVDDLVIGPVAEIAQHAQRCERLQRAE